MTVVKETRGEFTLRKVHHCSADYTIKFYCRCDGGGLSRSFLCMINIGVAISSKYPYKAINQVCPKKPKVDYKIPNGAYSNIQGDEDMLVMLLNKYGPIVVAIGKQA